MNRWIAKPSERVVVARFDQRAVRSLSEQFRGSASVGAHHGHLASEGFDGDHADGLGYTAHGICVTGIVGGEQRRVGANARGQRLPMTGRVPHSER